MAEQVINDTSGTPVHVNPMLEQIITESNCDMDSVFGKDKLSILVSGKTGIGKSALINSLAGAEVSKVKDAGDANCDLGRGTTELKEECVKLHGKVVSLWDSPGLQDETGADKKYVDAMYEQCRDVDLILYCMDMTMTRWAVQEINATTIINEKFGCEFWGKTILVLTRANAVWLSIANKEKAFIYHQNVFNNILKALKDQLIALNVPTAIVENIPAVAVGYIELESGEDEDFEGRYIWYTSNKAHGYTAAQCSGNAAPKESKKEKTDFLPEFWVTCLERVSVASRDTFWKIARGDRVELAENVPEETIELFEKQKEEMKIIEAEYGPGHNGPKKEEATGKATPPTTGEATPTTGEATPTTGKATPTTGKATPTTGEATPTTGKATPTTRKATPTTPPTTNHYKNTAKIVLNKEQTQRTSDAITEANDQKRSWFKRFKETARKGLNKINPFKKKKPEESDP